MKRPFHNWNGRFFVAPPPWRGTRGRGHTNTMGLPNEDLNVAVRGLIGALTARGAGDPAKILLEGIHTVAGAGGWALLLPALVTVRTLYDSQLLADERRMLNDIYDAICA